MNAMQPAIQVLQSRADQLREELRGIEAAIGVLRGSTALTPPVPTPVAEPAGRPLSDDEILAAVDELGPRAFVVNLAVRLGVPGDRLRETLVDMERKGLVTVIALGPKHGLVERPAAPVRAASDGHDSRGEQDSGCLARDAKAEQLLGAIAELGPAVGNDQLIDRLGWHRTTIIRQLTRLEAEGRIRRTGATRGRRIALVGAPIGANTDARVHSSSLDREAENEHAEAPEASKAEEPAPAPKPAPKVETPPPVAKVEPARQRRVVDPAPASKPRSANSRPVERGPAPMAPVSRHRASVSADDRAAIERHLAEKGVSRYEPGTLIGIMERTFAAEGIEFSYDHAYKAARAPYVVGGRSLTPAKAIERANEIRRRRGLELLAVPGKPGKGGKR